jgi:hypothetical protein
VNAFDAPIEQEVEDSTLSPQAPVTQFAMPSFRALIDSTFNEDKSTPLPSMRNSNRQVSTLELSLGIWCTNAGISRPLYSTLLSVMDQLRDDAANKLDQLPKRLDTTKRRIKEQLPLLELRRRPYLSPRRSCRRPLEGRQSQKCPRKT